MSVRGQDVDPIFLLHEDLGELGTQKGIPVLGFIQLEFAETPVGGTKPESFTPERQEEKQWQFKRKNLAHSPPLA